MLSDLRHSTIDRHLRSLHDSRFLMRGGTGRIASRQSQKKPRFHAAQVSPLGC